MKLATLKDDTRDGKLVVVSRDLSRAVSAETIAPTFQTAIESWPRVASRLQTLYGELNDECIPSLPFHAAQVSAPLPRAYQWIDGSAFSNHGQLMIKAFNLPPDIHWEGIPLMYQGGSDDFLGPCDDALFTNEADNIDFEGEIAVIVDDVPMGVRPDEAPQHIKLVMIANDWSLRAHARREMDTGFGFFHAKPSTSFSPVAVTLDELGDAWNQDRLHLPLRVEWNNEWFGNPNGGEMTFSFAELIAYGAKTRRLRAGTILGSGTVSNGDRSTGCATLAERRAIEMIETGQVQTRFMRFGDRIRMEVLNREGRSVFGAIDQRVGQYLPDLEHAL